MVAVLLRFFKDPRNDEIALQHFFFFLTAAQEFFFFYINFVLHAIFFFRQTLAGNFFSKSPTRPPSHSKVKWSAPKQILTGDKCYVTYFAKLLIR